MEKRRTRSEAFSLFAFQDIITSVTGVIVLVALLLAIELVQRSIVAAPPLPGESPADRILQLDHEIESLRSTLRASDELVAQLASLPSSDFAQREAELRRTKEQLAIEVDRLAAAIRGAENQSVIEQLSDEIARLEDTIPTLRSKVAELQAQIDSIRKSHRVTYNPNPFDKKNAWLVDLSAQGILVGRPGQTDPFVEFKDINASAVVAQFINWARQRNRSTEYFVLLLRPQAIRLYETIHQKLTASGFETGVDLLEADATVMGPVND